MSKIQWNYKRMSLWVLVITQVLLLIYYFYLKADKDIIENSKISFVKSENKEPLHKLLTYTFKKKTFLKRINTHMKFINFNSSLCFKNGTDLISMKRSKDFEWECKCFPGWHGKDCGQPEVIWRAFLTYRQPINIIGPRTFERRIIYIFAIDKFSETLAEIAINELGDTIDLFILYEDENSDFLQRKLNNDFVKNFHKKILYLQTNNIDNSLHLIKNLKEDDIILIGDRNEIPNKFALNFLKLYNKWPELIRFRMKWSIYGFFWLHPKKTIISGGACSVSYLRTFLNGKIKSILRTKNALILGDLNHSGGWYCEYCLDTSQILECLTTKKQINFEKIKQLKIDQTFLEEAIENGLYIDGKSELLRTHRYQDNYFAPSYVIENRWNYEYLLTNLYSKIDYYER